MISKTSQTKTITNFSSLSIPIKTQQLLDLQLRPEMKCFEDVPTWCKAYCFSFCRICMHKLWYIRRIMSYSPVISLIFLPRFHHILQMTGCTHSPPKINQFFEGKSETNECTRKLCKLNVYVFRNYIHQFLGQDVKLR